MALGFPERRGPSLLSPPFPFAHAQLPFPPLLPRLLPLPSPLPPPLFLSHILCPLSMFLHPDLSLKKKKNQSTERLDLQMSGQETGNKGNQSRRGAGIITVINSSSRDTSPSWRLLRGTAGEARGAGLQATQRRPLPGLGRPHGGPCWPGSSSWGRCLGHDMSHLLSWAPQEQGGVDPGSESRVEPGAGSPLSSLTWILSSLSAL